MGMFNVKVKAKHNGKKIDKIVNSIPEAVKKGVQAGIENMQKIAIRIKRGRTEGILVEMVDMNTKEIKGRVYTDTNTLKTAWFEEFGTGLKAELPHIGTTRTFIESGYEYWLIPVDKVGRKLSYPIVGSGGKQFYLAHGVEPNPFMRTAGFEGRQQNVEEVKKALKSMIKEVAK